MHGGNAPRRELGGAGPSSATAGPDQVVPILRFDHRGVDGGREARVVERDGKVPAIFGGGPLSGCAEFGLAGDDAEIRGLVVRLVVGPELGRLHEHAVDLEVRDNLVAGYPDRQPYIDLLKVEGARVSGNSVNEIRVAGDNSSVVSDNLIIPRAQDQGVALRERWRARHPGMIDLR